MNLTDHVRALNARRIQAAIDAPAEPVPAPKPVAKKKSPAKKATARSA